MLRGPGGERVLEPVRVGAGRVAETCAYAEQVHRHAGVDPTRKAADHVHVAAGDVEVVLLRARGVLELVDVLRVHGGANADRRPLSRLRSEPTRCCSGGRDGHPERPTNGARHWVFPSLGNGWSVERATSGRPTTVPAPLPPRPATSTDS